MSNSMCRKRFLRMMGASALAAGIYGCGGGSGTGGGGGTGEAPRSRREKVTLSGTQLAVVTGSSPEAITRRAIEELGGMGVFVSKGDKVLLKPNIGWDRVPEQAATTNPEVVRTLAMMCLDAGAAKVFVLDNTISDPRRCYTRSGIKAVADEVGAEMPFLEDYNFTSVNVGGALIKEWPVYKAALEVDKIINVPIAKHHSLSRLTIGMKNFYGLVGGRRNQLHQDVHLSIAEMTAFFAPTLTVVDAVRILTGNGPSGGSLSDVKQTNTVIAAVDPVAADARAAALFGVDPSEIRYLVLGAELGLGTLDPATLAVKEVVALMRNARRISQIFFFVLFLFLLVMTEYKGTDEIRYPVKIFFDFDPLVALVHLPGRPQRAENAAVEPGGGAGRGDPRPLFLRLGLPDGHAQPRAQP